MTYLALVKTIALAELGNAEISGAGRNNKRIVAYHKATGLPNEPDETPWCSSFVNWVVKKAGKQGTNSASARSWLKWGKSTTKPKQFDIVVFWRGEPNGWQGHVAFYLGTEGSTVKVLGGNQGNKVSVANYPKARVLSYRTAE